MVRALSNSILAMLSGLLALTAGVYIYWSVLDDAPVLSEFSGVLTQQNDNFIVVAWTWAAERECPGRLVMELVDGSVIRLPDWAAPGQPGNGMFRTRLDLPEYAAGKYELRVRAEHICNPLQIIFPIKFRALPVEIQLPEVQSRAGSSDSN